MDALDYPEQQMRTPPRPTVPKETESPPLVLHSFAESASSRQLELISFRPGPGIGTEADLRLVAVVLDPYAMAASHHKDVTSSPQFYNLWNTRLMFERDGTSSATMPRLRSSGREG